MFIGTEYKALDSKGRLVIPSKFRKAPGLEEGEGFYALGGPGPYIILYTKTEWEKVYEKVSRSSAQEGNIGDVRRTFFANADFIQLDRQGRVVLPEAMVAQAGLAADVAVLGGGDHLEIWDRDRWEAYRKERMKNQDGMLWRAFLG